MAVPTNTYQTVTNIGIREDLSDVITNIAPVETPFYTSVSKGKATNTFHEWLTDDLASAATNAAIEGDDTTSLAASPATRLGNYTQIFKKVVQVSGTNDAVNKAGRSRETAYQLMKRLKECKRDVEFALTRNQASDAGGAATARTLASTESWLTTNKTHLGAAGTTPGYSSGTVAAPTDGTQAGSFTEALLKSIIQGVWNSGGDVDTILTGPVNKQKASAFSGIATQYRENRGTAQATILAGADVYVSDFGVHNVVPSRFCRDRTVQLFDMSLWKVADLRPMKQEKLAKTGDSEKFHILCELTLECLQEAGNGKIADLQTS